MSRFCMILVLLAVCQAGAIFLIRSNNPESIEGPSAAKVFATFSIQEVAEVFVEDGGSQDSIVLARRQGVWCLPDKDGFRLSGNRMIASPNKAGSLGILDKLAGLKVKTPMVKLKKNHDVMGVGEQFYSRRVTLKDLSGEILATIYVARGSNGQSCFIRNAGEAKVYETKDLRIWEFSPVLTNWTGRDLVNIPEDEIESLQVTRGDNSESYTLGRAKVPDPKMERAWKILEPIQGDVQQDVVHLMLAKITTMALEDVYGKSEPRDSGFDAPLVRYTLIMRDGSQEVITIGKQRQDGDYTAHWAPSASVGSGYYVLVPAWAIENAVKTNLDDLLRARRK